LKGGVLLEKKYGVKFHHRSTGHNGILIFISEEAATIAFAMLSGVEEMVLLEKIDKTTYEKFCSIIFSNSYAKIVGLHPDSILKAEKQITYHKNISGRETMEQFIVKFINNEDIIEI
jgi:hypothetical protein